MRVTQRMVSRNYLNSLNTTLTRRAESFERSTTGLKFTKLSQNVADGTRAMKIQEERYKSEQQLSNVESILSEMNSIDSNLESIDSILQTAQEKLLQALNQQKGDPAGDVLAQEIASIKEQVVQFANAQFGGKYLFSGTNNATAPFTVDENSGKLCFNGIELEKISYKNGKYVYTDDAGKEQEVPNSGDVYMDIGLGLKIGEGLEPDPRSAFKVSFSGMDVLGFGAPVTGEHGTQVASNAYDLLTQIEESLKNGYNKDELSDLHAQLVEVNDNMRMSRTDLGTRMNFLERNQTRLENDVDNLSEMESKLISSDPATEAINLSMCNYAWMAVLQLGSQVLPSSLLDFMR